MFPLHRLAGRHSELRIGEKEDGLEDRVVGTVERKVEARNEQCQQNVEPLLLWFVLAVLCARRPPILQ